MKAGGEGDNGGQDDSGITDSMDEFEQALIDGEEQGSLVCCSPWGHRDWHNWVTEQQHIKIFWSSCEQQKLVISQDLERFF